MIEKEAKAITLKVVEPYDFALSLRVIRSFQPALAEQNERLELAARIAGVPTTIEVSQTPSVQGTLRVSASPETDNRQVRDLAAWVLFADLDLKPFFRLAARDPRLRPVMNKLKGVKPMRPASLFEMAVIAITEQQISLAAAYKIRNRMIEKFGEPLKDLWVFPEPARLAEATPEELRACGLSRQKAGYILDLAKKVAGSALDLDALKSMDDDKARETIMALRGFGRWSADYFLVRGLARPDSVPVDDLAVRSVVGEYLGDAQQRPSADEITKLLQPFKPYRGLLAFYLLAAKRLKPQTST